MGRDIRTYSSNKEGGAFDMANDAFENEIFNRKGWRWGKKYEKYAKHFAKMKARVNAVKIQANRKRKI